MEVEKTSRYIPLRTAVLFDLDVEPDSLLVDIHSRVQLVLDPSGKTVLGKKNTYRVLSDLVREGLVDVQDAPPVGRGRKPKRYSLNESGASTLDFLRQQLNHMIGSV